MYHWWWLNYSPVSWILKWMIKLQILEYFDVKFQIKWSPNKVRKSDNKNCKFFILYKIIIHFIININLAAYFAYQQLQLLGIYKGQRRTTAEKQSLYSATSYNCERKSRKSIRGGLKCLLLLLTFQLILSM